MLTMGCLLRILSETTKDYSGNILVEIMGIICFAGLVQLYSTFRLKQILGEREPSVYQMKLLAFMIGHLDEYLEHLTYFIIQHHKNCSDVQCTCRGVIDHLVSKESVAISETVWYSFLVKFC